MWSSGRPRTDGVDPSPAPARGGGEGHEGPRGDGSGCRFPGCSNRLFTDAHHIEHWLDGGETSLGNTVLLCRRHHRHLHEHGFSLERVGEMLVFRDPRGKEVPAQGARSEVRADAATAVAAWRGGPVSAEVNAPGWDGEPVDYDLCVAALAAR